MVEGTRFIIWGSLGHAKVIASLITLNGGHVVAIFDNNQQAAPAIRGVPLYIGIEGFKSWIESELDRHNLCGLVAIGGSRGRDRLSIHEIFRSYGLRIEPIIHPQASVCVTSHLGAGTQVLAQAVVAADVHVGEACIINHSATVDHECILGDGVHIAPGATLCGCVHISNNVMIGAGAILLPRVKINENTIVGAGAVVTSDLPAGVIAIGGPARIVRNI